MSYSGGVLSKTMESFLFNNGVGPNELGGYMDTISNIPMMILKKQGVSISPKKYNITCNDPGAWRAILVSINPDCPCDECNYEYGFKVKSQFKMPGVYNSELKPVTNHYTGVLSAVECSDGKIITAQQIIMENSIIDQINDYNPKSQVVAVPAQYASRFYIIEDEDTTDASTLTITIDGTDYAITGNGANDTLVQEINADAGIAGRVNAMYLSDPSDGTTYTFAIFATGFNSSNNAGTFTVTEGTDTDIEQRSILVLSREKELLISVETDNSFATTEGINIAKIYNVDGDAIDNYCYTFSDSLASVSKAKNANCCVDNAFSFDANDYDDASTWQITSNDNTNVIYAFSDDDDGYIFPEDESEDNVLQLGTKKGKFEVLSADEVYREFANQPNDGILKGQRRKTDGLNIRYCKITISWESVIADLVGANHMNLRVGGIQLYVPMSTKCVDAFNTANPMNAGQGEANANLLEFIQFIIDGNFDESSSS